MVKWLAFILMLIDHIGFFLFDMVPPIVYDLMRGLGRLAMPLFAFSLAYGFTKSENWLKYLIRLLFTAIVSEFVIIKCYALLGFHRSLINIVFMFSCSLVFLIALKILLNSGYDLLVRMQPVGSTGIPENDLSYDFRVNLGGIELPPILGLILGLIFMLISSWLIIRYDMEYGIYGLLTVVAFYIVLITRPKHPLILGIILLIVVNLIFQTGYLLNLGSVFEYNSLQWLTVAAVPFCFYKEEERVPAKWQKYFFYIAYPVQYIILTLIRYLLTA
ncbi:MAG: TraX family protein [Saccharofermentanales bacterium]